MSFVGMVMPSLLPVRADRIACVGGRGSTSPAWLKKVSSTGDAHGSVTQGRPRRTQADRRRLLCPPPRDALEGGRGADSGHSLYKNCPSALRRGLEPPPGGGRTRRPEGTDSLSGSWRISSEPLPTEQAPDRLDVCDLADLSKLLDDELGVLDTSGQGQADVIRHAGASDDPRRSVGQVEGVDRDCALARLESEPERLRAPREVVRLAAREGDRRRAVDARMAPRLPDQPRPVEGEGAAVGPRGAAAARVCARDVGDDERRRRGEESEGAVEGRDRLVKGGALAARDGKHHRIDDDEADLTASELGRERGGLVDEGAGHPLVEERRRIDAQPPGYDGEPFIHRVGMRLPIEIRGRYGPQGLEAEGQRRAALHGHGDGEREERFASVAIAKHEGRLALVEQPGEQRASRRRACTRQGHEWLSCAGGLGEVPRGLFETLAPIRPSCRHRELFAERLAGGRIGEGDGAPRDATGPVVDHKLAANAIAAAVANRAEFHGDAVRPAE